MVVAEAGAIFGGLRKATGAACLGGLGDKVCTVGGLQQVVEPCQAAGVTGAQEVGLGGEVGNQQLVDQVNDIFAGMLAGDAFLLLEAVDEGRERLRALLRRFVELVEKLAGDGQCFCCQIIFIGLYILVCRRDSR